MKHGARNDIVGTVTSIKKDTVMAHAKVSISGDFELSSVMTAESLASLKLKKGDKVHVIVKAVSVLLVKE